MGRLKQLPARLGSLAPKLGGVPVMDEAARSRRRDVEDALRRNYKTARWQKLRWSVLVRDAFTCRMCGRVEVVTSQLVADHRVPAVAMVFDFWDASNLQCLCKGCHDGKKQSEERRAGGR